ncbi:hypothetical protein MGMO_47c00200 [Methyloglobulus morosus KoM1]|uniref:Uncharacterized protein n=1 Tax=Methyloglobulus morosus KoM1 TaxID=1116472 RepID=V5C2R6_9GAMM|nr:hypothetical protein [Methyloglobulus morosus]ESS72752.1 hypothetical protein MGMO_47c00200 [Methyloglobulus morosus KoM1]
MFHDATITDQDVAIIEMGGNSAEKIPPIDFSIMISYNGDGKKAELLINGEPACFKTTKGEPVELTDFIVVSLKMPERHMNNFPEEFDEQSIRILNALNWCKVGGKWVTCKGPC